MTAQQMQLLLATGQTDDQRPGQLETNGQPLAVIRDSAGMVWLAVMDRLIQCWPVHNGRPGDLAL